MKKTENEQKYLYNKIKKLEREIKNREKKMKEAENKLIFSEEEIEKYKLIIKENMENLNKYRIDIEKENMNFRKRIENETDKVVFNQKKRFLIRFIEVLAHFEYALASISDENTKKGIEMVYSEFLRALSEENVEIIDRTDVEFNPAIHNAIGVENKKGAPSNRVIKIIRRGFRIGNEIIRHADCIVSK